MLDRLSIKYFKMAIGHDALGKETDMDISARCPICGDSQRKKNSKRLHLYTKNGFDNDLVSCFNGDCPCQNKTVYSFLRDHYPSLLTQYKKENFGNTMQKLASGSGDVFESLKNKEETKRNIVTHNLFSYFEPIENCNEALDYIEKRGFIYKKMNYGNWFFCKQDLKIGDKLYKTSNSLVIPLYYNDEMYGFYSRNIYNKEFATYMPEANIGYKVWNFFNVNLNEKVYIFEGIFDAIASGKKNVIALMGAKLPEERLKEIKYPVFCLDNDKTGLLNSLNYARKGYNVYIQPNNILEKDMNDVLLHHDNLNIPNMIDSNIFTNIMAEVRIKSKL